MSPSGTDMSIASREWHLIARPSGEPKPSDFGLITTPLPEPRPGQIVVRNDWMSVDPYMRGRMDDRPSYIPPFELGKPMTGNAVGTVLASLAPEVPVGATVLHFLGWREHAVLDASAAQLVDTELAPAQAYLGVLGTTGLTAWVGLTEIAPVREGDVVWVSAAAGGVGSVAGQMARQLGASRVIGSAGGPGKVRRAITDFGYDVCLDYRAGDLRGQLTAAAPGGIDVYFDNVGGDHLNIALAALKNYGRVALCGAVSVYNDTTPAPGPRNLPMAIAKRLSLRGFIVIDHFSLMPTYLPKAAGWLRDGSLRADETVVSGIENAREAFMAMMGGANTGKMLVRL
jgi:NADPH-dependent curcumin reductase CurA